MGLASPSCFSGTTASELDAQPSWGQQALAVVPEAPPGALGGNPPSIPPPFSPQPQQGPSGGPFSVSQPHMSAGPWCPW